MCVGKKIKSYLESNIGTHRLTKRLLTASVCQMPRCFATWTCCERMD